MCIKMIVSDLDGTLFNSDQENYMISPELIKAVKNLKEKDIIFTIATGRPEYSSKPVVEKLNIKAPYIIYNGAVVVDEDGKVIYNKYFELNAFKEFLYSIDKVGGTVLLYFNKKVHYLKFTDKIPIYERKEKVKCEQLNSDLVWDNLTANKILLIGDIQKFKNEWEKLGLSFRRNFRYVISEYNYFEILKNGVSKGEALKFLKRYLKLPDNSVVGIGNHLNDKEFLEEAHIGIAVSNADENLKNIADYVTENPYEKGVLEVIENINRRTLK